jgi:hypothetical protein
MRIARVLLVCGTLAAALALVPSASAGDGAKPLDEHVLWALRWLKNHQSTDGRWDAKSYSEQCKLNRCEGAGDAAHASSATGFALLSFLCVGETQRGGPYRDAVKNGLAYLRGIQDAQGCFGSAAAPNALYEHAVAELAMCEANGMTADPDLAAPAQKGVDFLFSSPAAAGPWRADFAKDGAVKPEALAWTVCVLKSAEMSKLAVDGEALKRVVVWIDARTDAKTGAVTDPATKRADDVLTATGVLARAFAGRTPKTDPVMTAAAATVARNVPPDATAPVARHFAALAVFVAAPDVERTRWCAAAKAALETSQRMEPDRDERGSWDPKDASTKAGGRVVATALSCMTLTAVGHVAR